MGGLGGGGGGRQRGPPPSRLQKKAISDRAAVLDLILFKSFHMTRQRTELRSCVEVEVALQAPRS